MFSLTLWDQHVFADTFSGMGGMLANFSKRNLFFGDLSLMLPAHFQYTKPPLVKRFFFL